MPTMVLRAFNAELAQIPDSVKQEALVQIRMQWWRDAVKSAYSGRPEPNPIILALREVRHDIPFMSEACKPSPFTAGFSMVQAQYLTPRGCLLCSAAEASGAEE